VQVDGENSIPINYRLSPSSYLRQAQSDALTNRHAGPAHFPGETRNINDSEFTYRFSKISNPALHVMPAGVPAHAHSLYKTDGTPTILEGRLETPTRLREAFRESLGWHRPLVIRVTAWGEAGNHSGKHASGSFFRLPFASHPLTVNP
jgi:hypothetical protein